METCPTDILTIIFAYDLHMLDALSKLENIIAFSTAKFSCPNGLSILQRVQRAYMQTRK